MKNILLQETFVKQSECLEKHCVCGVKKEKSNVLKPKVGIEDILCHKKIRNEKLSMPESLPVNKNMTLKDKLLSCNPNIRTMKSFQISDLDLTSKEEASRTFWSPSLTEISKKLWLPTKTDFLDSDSISFNLSSNTMDHFSQSSKMTYLKNQSKNLQTTSCLSLRFSLPDTMDNEDTLFACKKIRIYPNLEQTRLFEKCLGSTRYFYNKANQFVKEQIESTKASRFAELEELKKKGCVHTNCGQQLENEFFCKKHTKTGTLGISYKFLTLPKIRDAILTPDSKLDESNIWMKEVPYDTRQLAIKSLVSAYSSAFALKKKGHIQSFDIHFKKKKAINQVFFIDASALKNDNKIFVQRLKKKGKLRFRKRYLSKIVPCEKDFTILKTKPGKWYICIPYEKKKPIYENACYKSVFLDPGVRTFQTFYSPDGICGKIGDNYCNDFLLPIGYHIDKLESVYSKTIDSKTRRNLRNRMAKLRDKLKNRTKDLHCKTCCFLCKGFRTIFLPKFKPLEMIPNLRSKIVRNMLSLSHGKFRDRIIEYAKTKHRQVILVSEHYTTKTCGICGHQNNIGCSKIFQCSNCNNRADRDLHAARNICLKTINSLL